MTIENIISAIQEKGYNVEASGVSSRGLIKLTVTSDTYYSEFLISEEVVTFLKPVQLEHFEQFLDKVKEMYKAWEARQDLNEDLPVIALGNYEQLFR